MCKGFLEKSEIEINFWNIFYLYVIKWLFYYLVWYFKGLKILLKFLIILNVILI